MCVKIRWKKIKGNYICK